MNNAERYTGKLVQIYAPPFTGGRKLHKLHVEEVLDNNVLAGTIQGTDIRTAYYLSDGISAEVLCDSSQVKLTIEED